jgi:hypothetical protein
MKNRGHQPTTMEVVFVGESLELATARLTSSL